MIVRLLEVVAWLSVGHALVGALFWGLLQVPESTVWMLGLSAVTVILMVVLAGWTEWMGMLAWTGVTPIGARLRQSLAGLPAVLAGAALMALVWWPTEGIADWLAVHRGEIDAWLMVHLGWTRTGWIHAGAAWGLWIVRYGLGLSAGLTLVAVVARRGYRDLTKWRWLKSLLAPRQVLAIAFWLLFLVWIPWQLRSWRPRGLPPSSLEAAFVVTKLLVIYALMNLGWALVLRTPVARLARTDRQAPPGPLPPDPTSS